MSSNWLINSWTISDRHPCWPSFRRKWEEVLWICERAHRTPAFCEWTDSWHCVQQPPRACCVSSCISTDETKLHKKNRLMFKMVAFRAAHVWNHRQQATVFCVSGSWSPWTTVTRYGRILPFPSAHLHDQWDMQFSLHNAPATGASSRCPKSCTVLTHYCRATWIAVRRSSATMHKYRTTWSNFFSAL
jgi:hypothetical protein